MIGIIGIYYNVRNFGAQLQARALQVAIQKKGYPCKWVCFDYKTGIFNPFVTNNINSELNGEESDFWNQYAKTVEPDLTKRKNAFDSFQAETDHFEREYHVEDLHEVLNECDRLIIGGDQVWNDFYFMAEPHMADCFTLNFVPDGMKTFSFSASTGGGRYLSIEQQKRLTPGLRRLGMISCREKSSVPMLEALSEKKVTCVLDSAFLLSPDEWKSIRKPAQSIAGKDKFAMCCFMGRFPEWREASKSICKKTNTKVLAFPHLGESRYYKVDYSFGDIRDFSSGPAEFLDLIDKSEFVITDSFHACVFSIIYNKPFYVFLRDESNRNLKTNARIEDMLNEFGLSNRIVSPDELLHKDKFEPINYSMVNRILATRRQESIDFLDAALNMERS